jgi:hypothetical protein
MQSVSIGGYLGSEWEELKIKEIKEINDKHRSP